MRSTTFALALWAIVLPASAATLSAAEAARLARERSPSVVAARARAAIARALVPAAAARPEAGSIELSAGPRYSSEDEDLDAEIAWERPFDRRARRVLRISSAEAETHAAELDLLVAEGRAATEARLLHVRVLHADALMRLAGERVDLARELLETASEREKAGDISRLEVNAARVELARAESAQAAVSGAPETSRALLAAATGLDTAALELSGSLEDPALLAGIEALASLAATPGAAPSRPDVRAAQAERAWAESELALIQATARPPLAFRLAAMREEDAHALMAGVVIPLGSPARARAEAEAATLRREAAGMAVLSAERSARAEIAAALASRAAATSAASLLAVQGVALADENAALAREGWAAGKFDLASTLLMRRDALDARREHLDLQLEAALAAIELWAALGSPEPFPGDSP